MTDRVHIDGLTFELRRSARRRTVSVTVERQGTLVIRAPESLALSQIQSSTRGRLMWVHRKLAGKAASLPRRRAPEFVSGEMFSYLGRLYPLSVRSDATRDLAFDGQRFVMQQSASANAERLFREWYVSAGREWLLERVDQWAGPVGETPDKVIVRSLGYRWGSSGRNRVVYFDWRLLQLPPRCVDYVVAHELTHLRHRQHGKEFWQHLDAAMPNYRERMQALESSAKEFMVFGIDAGAGV